MKKYIPYLFVGLTLLTDACENPVKDVELKFRQPIPVAVEMQFKTASGELPKDFQIQLVGPDAARVVSPLNTAKYRVSDEGRLYLSVTPSVTPSDASPLRFTVVATAAGYADLVQPVQLTSAAGRQFVLDVLPKTATDRLVEVKASSDNSGTVQTPVAAATTSSATTLSVAQGTQLKDASGQAVDGALTVQLNQVSTSTTAIAAAQLPGSGVIAQASGASQQVVAVAGAIKIEMFNGEYQNVKTFSKPVRLAFALSSQLLNPRTNRTIQPGDDIALFSYDIATQRWQQEPSGVVERNAQGTLEYVAQISHLSYWMAAFTETVCDNGPVFRVSSPIPAGNLTYRCEVVDATTGTLISTPSGTYAFRSTINQGQLIRLSNVVSGRQVRLKVYDNESGTVVTSAPVESCSSTETELNLTSFKTPTALPVSVKLALEFPCAELNEAKLPTRQIYAQYREVGTKEWKSLPVLAYQAGKTSFSIDTYDLTVGKTYDFRAGPAVGNYIFSQPAYKLEKAAWIIKVDTDEYCK